MVLVAVAATFAVTGVMQARAEDPDPGAEQLSQEIGRALERLGDLGGFGPLADGLPLSDVLPGDASDLAKVFHDDAPEAFGAAETGDSDSGGDCYDGDDDDGDGIADDGCGDDPDVDSLADRFVDEAGDGLLTTFDGIFDALQVSEDVAGLTVSISEAQPLTGVTDAHENPDGIDWVQDPSTGDIDFAVVLDISGTFSAPIDVPTELVDLVAVDSQGLFDVPIQLTSTPLQFHLDFDLAFDDVADAAAPTLDEALWLLVQPDAQIAGESLQPAFDLSIGDGSGHDVADITDELDLGFVGVDLSGDSVVALQLMWGLSMVDPDTIGGGTSDGKILVDELATTSLDELFDVTVHDPTGPDANAVTATLELGTDLLGAADDTDLTVHYVAPTLADVATATPTFEFPNPDDFGLDFFRKLQSFTPSDALGGVDRLVGMLTAIQGAGLVDLDLPYFDSGTCDNGVDDDKDGVVDDGCLGSENDAVSVPETGSSGGFSDALELGRTLVDAVQSELIEEPDPDALGTIIPTFTNAHGLADALGTAFGIDLDPVLDVDDPEFPRIEYEITLSDTATVPLALRFGDLDIVNDIVITGGGAVDLTATYEIPLTFALDMTPEPTEGTDGDAGSCANGEDDDTDGDTDGMDGDCANARTLEQRVQVYVGSQTEGPTEVTATMAIDGSGISAIGKVGILEVGVTGATVQLGNQALDGPASLSVDLSTESNGGWLTIEEFIAALGQPADPSWAARWTDDQWHRHVDVDAGFDATVPVGASVNGVSLAGGSIGIAGGLTDSLEDAHAGIGNGAENAFDLSAFTDSITVTPDLSTSDIFNFSGCGNGEDDDGDGTPDDGCEGGPAAVEAPESESAAVFDQILDGVRALAAQFGGLGGGFGDEIPLIGKSFDDLVDIAGALDDFADLATQGAEGLIPGACDNSANDDGDLHVIPDPDVEAVNDGCPQVGETAEGGLDCLNAGDDDGDGAVNDGCDAVAPTLQQLGSVIDRLLTRAIGDGLAQLLGDEGLVLGNDALTATVDYDSGANEVTFDVTINEFSATGSAPLIAGLPDLMSGEALPDLVSIGGSGVVNLTVSGSGSLAFGLELDDFTPFVLGKTGLTVDATAATADEGVTFEAGVGPITLAVGDATAVAETACPDGEAETDNTADDDHDGFVNDGCDPIDGGESGDQCLYGDTTDDDGDGFTNDGCVERGDTAHAYLGAQLDVKVAGNDTDKRYFDAADGPVASIDADLGGTVQDECQGVTVAGFSGDKHACAVLPLYLGEDPLPNDTADHHVSILADISGPEVKAVYPGAEGLGQAIAGSVIDLLLLESGIGPLIDQLIGFLSDGLLSVDIPVVGDALDSVLAIVQHLRDGLGGGVVTALTDGGELTDPLADLEPFGAPASDVAQIVQDEVADPLAEALAGAGILLDATAQDRQPLTAQDVQNGHAGSVQAITICGEDSEDNPRPCDYGAENDPNNPAAADSDGAANNCATPDDEDGDGYPNDGCEGEVPNGETNCDGSVDDDGDGTVDDGCPYEDNPAVDVDPETNCDGTEDDDNDGTVDDGCAAIDTVEDFEEGDDPEQHCTNDTDDDGDGVANDGCDPVVDKAADVTDIAFSFRIGQAASTSFGAVDAEFGAGIPGLGLKVDNLALQATAGWDLDLVIGISKDAGFYFVTDEVAVLGEDGDNDPSEPEQANPEFNADAVVAVSEPGGTAASASGSLAFLNATITDGAATTPSDAEPPVNSGIEAGKSFLEVHAQVNLRDPGPTNDGRMTFNELTSAPSFGDVVEFNFGGGAELHLGLSVGVDGAEGMPRLVTGLHLDWEWSVTGASDTAALEPGGPTSTLNMHFDGLSLDAGSFVSQFLGPVFADIQEFTKAFEPIIEVINTPIPVLSDFAGEPVTMRTLGEALAAAYDIDLTLLDMVIDLIAFVNSIPSYDENAPAVLIPLTDAPTLDLNASRLRQGPLPSSQALQAYATSPLDSFNDIRGDLTNAVGSIGAPSSNETSGGSLTVGGMLEGGPSAVGVSFPFLEHPERLAGLLFGQHVTLIQWEPPPLVLKFCYSQKFGPIWSVPPVFVEFGGCVGLKGEFGIGYNTKGFERAFWSGGGTDVSGLLQGLFLIDRHPLEGGSDTNELEFTGEIFVNAQVSVLIFSAGAQGSLVLTIGIDLQDPNSDGILEFGEAAEIIKTTGSVLCIFNLNGSLSLRFSVFAEVDLFFWSQRWTKVLADIVLFEFKVECDPLAPPRLARGDGTILYLNVGVDARFRDPEGKVNATNPPTKSIGKDVIDEVWTVTRTETGVNVRALDFSQDYDHPDGPNGWTKVVATDAGAGDDKIAFVDGQLGAETGDQCANDVNDDPSSDDPSTPNVDESDTTVNDGCPVQKPADPTVPEECDDALDNDGNGFINEGCPIDGPIVLLPFDIEVEVHGGGDNDIVTGGVKGGTLAGDGGDDVLVARYNEGMIGSQLNSDYLWTLHGGDGSDSITGSPGNDNITGGDHADDIDAGPGADDVVGGGGDDTIIGGNDIPANPNVPGSITLPDGADDVEGNGGRDTINGGPGNDEISGGADGDRLNGDTGNDIITGGTEDDNGCTADVDDRIIGGPGSDDIQAQGGDDIVVGGNTQAGVSDLGDSRLHGGSGCDIVLGDNAVFNNSSNPRIFTLLDQNIGGADTMSGGLGDDTLRGQKGDDTIRGDTGTNSQSADGTDQIWGDHGADDIWGNGGQDRIYGDGGPSHPQFPDDADNIAGGGDGDQIWGEGGADVILGDDGTFDPVTFNAGEHGADTIHGDAGDDDIYGQGSGDTLFGDGDDDEVHGDTDTTESGEDGADTIRGGTGNDLLFGNDGADRMWGDSGDDRIGGGSLTAGNRDIGIGIFYTDAYASQSGLVGDQIRGGSGDDVIGGDNITFSGFDATLLDESTEGQASFEFLGTLILHGDLVYGQLGNDLVYGERGADWIYGDAGEDHAEGGAEGDVIYGHAGQDDLIGGTTQPAAGNDPGVNGQQPDGGDKIFGNGSTDVIVGDNGEIIQTGGTRPGGALARSVTLYDLDSKDSTFFGADWVEGGMSSDDVYGGGADDRLYGYTETDAGDMLDGKDHIEGNDGADTINGDADQDDLIGGTSAHVDENADPTPIMSADGGSHPDDGTDVIHGGDGSTELAGDYDVILGDNATIERVAADPDTYQFDDLDPSAPAPRAASTGVLRRRIVLHDVALSGQAPPSSPVGAPADADELFGDDGWDEIYGQGANDLLEGGTGDDHLEGNAGDDRLYGEAGQDDAIGGTGRTVNDDPSTAEDGRLDGSDVIFGGEGDKDGDVDTEGIAADDYDVELGDNATILRGEPGEEWDYNTFNASVRRDVFLYDVGMVDDPADPGTGAADTMYGEADDDLMYGQVGDDEMYGGTGDDYMEGNDGADTIVGSAGNDDMIGGTGRINDDPVQGTPGRLDVGETEMRGSDGHDWMTGDNAIVERVLVDGEWVADPNGGFYRHVVIMPDLFDDAEPFGGSRDEDQVSGADTMFGDAGHDVMYGQGNRSLADDEIGDVMSGGAGQDHVEGNEGGDDIAGDGGEDDLIGGTGKVLGQDSFDEWTDAVPGDDDPDFDLSDEADEDLNFGVRHRDDGDDLMSGETGTDDDSATADGDADVILGDNAVVIRPVPGNQAGENDGQFPTGDDGLWQVRPENDSILRWIWFPDVESIFDDDPVADTTHGDDIQYGNEGDDEMWGQGGDDLMLGGIGDDRMQGNHASDEMYGGPDQDDMYGGTGRINNDPDEGTPGRLDAHDLMFGQGDHDAMVGDNAIVERPVVDDAWVTLTYLGYPDNTHAPEHVSQHRAENNTAPVAVGDIDDPAQRVERTDRVFTMIDAGPLTDDGSPLTAGSDLMSGGPGDDDMVGQFDDSAEAEAPFTRTRDELVTLCDTPDESTIFGDGVEVAPGVNGITTFGDVVCGNAGEDAILGDQGVIENRVEDGSRQEIIVPNTPFVRDWIFLEHTLSRLVTLDQFEHGGHDVILGGDHHDSIHAGAGGDLSNGDDGDDFVFADDGGDIQNGTRQDALWGGRGHDTSFGGNGDDFIDVQPRGTIENFPADPDDWFFFAPPDDGSGLGVDGGGLFRGFADVDHHYGGWDQDAFQADVGDNGPEHGDRLMDWVGAYNVYYLCPSTYGAWVSLRDQPPGAIEHMERLATGLGAVGVGEQGTSGYNEAAIVYKPDNKFNNQPPHPDTPGHFVCEGIHPDYLPQTGGSG